jgi:hypothetical protein
MPIVTSTGSGTVATSWLVAGSMNAADDVPDWPSSPL